jgi:XTP/dITP diphosphohydrolase
LPDHARPGMLRAVETLLLATRNRHKVGEIRGILGETIRYRVLTDWPDAPHLSETGRTFAENARQKVIQVLHWLDTKAAGVARAELPEGLWVLADDSGLEVDALGGAPGVESARFAALDTGAPGNSSDSENNAKLLRLMAGVPEGQRGARFRCVLALGRWPRQSEAEPLHCFEGVCEGRIGWQPRGSGGFGYDPLFYPEGFDRTFAELGEEVKNRISHRARALAALAEWWRSTHGAGEAGVRS